MFSQEEQESEVDALKKQFQQKDKPAQSVEPQWGRASCLQRCSGSAATKQDLCATSVVTSKVNWATTLDCVHKPSTCFQEEQGTEVDALKKQLQQAQAEVGSLNLNP